MINPFEQINWNPDDKALKSFGTSMLIGLCTIAILICAVNFFRASSHSFSFPLILASLGLLLFILSRIAPKAVIPVYYPWFFIAACIGIVVSNLILTAFFYLFFTPFAIGLKLFTGRDPLQLKKSADKKTYWTACSADKGLSRYLKQY